MDYSQLRKIATEIFYPIEIAVRSNNGAYSSWSNWNLRFEHEINSYVAQWSTQRRHESLNAFHFSSTLDTNFAIWCRHIFQCYIVHAEFLAFQGKFKLSSKTRINFTMMDLLGENLPNLAIIIVTLLMILESFCNTVYLDSCLTLRSCYLLITTN